MVTGGDEAIIILYGGGAVVVAICIIYTIIFILYHSKIYTDFDSGTITKANIVVGMEIVVLIIGGIYYVYDKYEENKTKRA